MIYDIEPQVYTNKTTTIALRLVGLAIAAYVIVGCAQNSINEKIPHATSTPQPTPTIQIIQPTPDNIQNNFEAVDKKLSGRIYSNINLVPDAGIDNWAMIAESKYWGNSEVYFVCGKYACVFGKELDDESYTKEEITRYMEQVAIEADKIIMSDYPDLKSSRVPIIFTPYTSGRVAGDQRI